MNVFEAISQRREITSFLDKKIPQADLETLLDAGYLAPSGNNLPSREFILVTARDKLDQLANATPFMPWLKQAQAGIVVTGRPDVSKYWLQDASIACGFIWLQAVELGLGAAFGAVYHSQDKEESKRRENFVRKELSIPSDRVVVAILGFGYPKEFPEKKKLLPREEIVQAAKQGRQVLWSRR